MLNGPVFDARGVDDPVVRSLIELLQAERSFVRRLISPALAPAFDAGDMLQECFLHCTEKKLQELRAMDMPARRDWVHRCLRRIVRDHRRSRRREEKRLHIVARNSEVDLEDNASTPEWFGALLRRLSRSDALLIVLVLVKGCPIDEAAKKTGLERCAAWRRLGRLKRMIENSCVARLPKLWRSQHGSARKNSE
jgi:DNA-directed RNA polymerase specialized sigma24 family protein